MAGAVKPPPPTQRRGQMKGRKGTANASSSRILPYSRQRIATTHITSNILHGVPVQDFTSEHGVCEAPDFMLDREQLAARLRMRDITEAILIRAALLRDQVMFLQPGMGA